MDLSQDNLAVYIETEHGALRGRIRRFGGDGSAAGDSRGEFLDLVEVTIFDREHRILRKCQSLAFNRRYIVWATEDDLGPGIERIKTFLATEDYENARQEVDRLMHVGRGDAEFLYVAGIVYGNTGQEEQSRALLNEALSRTLDERMKGVIQRHMHPADEAGA